MYHTTLRPAIAMIELIFALVIMGITLMSAPMLINQSIHSTMTGIQQEAIAATATQISLVMTHDWDESTTLSQSAGNDISSIVITGGVNELNQTNRTAALIPSMSRTYALPNPVATVPGALGMDNPNDAGSPDDVDDFNGLNSNFMIYAGQNALLGADEGDYIDINVNLNTIVAYGRDAVAAAGYAANPINFNAPFNNIGIVGSTNIKLINVTLTSNRADAEVQDKSISLSAFVCNIGLSNEAPVLKN